ncbi:LOW QUALITY PROTEIN: RAD9, HUS1, RAD1-interacting nuclear orphan protein 1 [Phycodurus eques]|uniref:LOW QUALITY PROTEIN: RAD9, HUS1, RAD1-interacting nuclear orphan protein 1 n=1 Tax=Phycodurus eques TaxID=693459 RepID=UPI002ACDD504|nr:LOW QUALITY PROTEIN: RAD9, HUS1, RAD1-interacting nuclear orphan protein 1 [Phycodurus eques]
MPRKSSKTAKPPLLFAERPVCGTRLQSGPEVRAALHPKQFFTETQTRSNLASWVNPQFDTLVEAAAPPARRGRAQEARLGTGIRDTCAQLFRKPAGKFPSLLFQSNGHPRHRHVATASGSRVTDSAGRPFKSVACQDAPKRRVLKKQNDAASSNLWATPNVDAPKETLKGGGISSPCARRLLALPRTPPSRQPPDVLVPDTPERDYGLKVTWRRRPQSMATLEARGRLAECDKLVAGLH